MKEKAENKKLEEVLSDDTLISELSELLIKTWEKESKKVWKKRATHPKDVESGVRALVSSGLVRAAELAGTGSMSSKVALVIRGIRLFQELADLQEKDGIFGRISSKAMRNFRGCNEREGRGDLLAEDSLARQHNEIFGEEDRLVVILCQIDEQVGERFDSMLGGPGRAVGLLADAWDLWIEHIDLSVKFIDEPDDANVLVTLAALDGRQGGTLADATIGGPGAWRQQLTLRIDEEEHFDQEKYLAVMAHEIGHLLGLRHHPTQGTLMSAFFDSTVLEPTPTDIRRIQAKWA